MSELCERQPQGCPAPEAALLPQCPHVQQGTLSASAWPLASQVSGPRRETPSPVRLSPVPALTDRSPSPDTPAVAAWPSSPLSAPSSCHMTSMLRGLCSCGRGAWGGSSGGRCPLFPVVGAGGQRMLGAPLRPLLRIQAALLATARLHLLSVTPDPCVWVSASPRSVVSP